jgi:hypothetical protein
VTRDVAAGCCAPTAKRSTFTRPAAQSPTASCGVTSSCVAPCCTTPRDLAPSRRAGCVPRGRVKVDINNPLEPLPPCRNKVLHAFWPFKCKCQDLGKDAPERPNIARPPNSVSSFALGMRVPLLGHLGGLILSSSTPSPRVQSQPSSKLILFPIILVVPLLENRYPKVAQLPAPHGAIPVEDDDVIGL